MGGVIELREGEVLGGRGEGVDLEVILGEVQVGGTTTEIGLLGGAEEVMRDGRGRRQDTVTVGEEEDRGVA